VILADVDQIDLRCTKPFVENVEVNVKYHLNQEVINQYIVTLVSQVIGIQNQILKEEIKIQDLKEEVLIDV